MSFIVPHASESSIPPFYTSQHRTDWVMRNNCHEPPQNLPYRAQQHLGTRADWGIFGCSNSWGQGLPQSQLYHAHLPGSVLNWAVPGTGTDAVLLQVMMARRTYTWRSTIIVLPSIHREMLRYRLPSGAWCRVPIEAHDADWYCSVWGQWCQAQQFPPVWLAQNRRHYQRRARRMVMQSRKRRFLRLLARIRSLVTGPVGISAHDPHTYDLLTQHLDTDRWQLLPFFQRVDLAADGRHAGQGSHELFAERILPIVQNW